MLRLPETQLLLCPLISLPVVGSSQPVPTRATSGFVSACWRYAFTPLRQSRPTIQLSEGTRPLKSARSWLPCTIICGLSEPEVSTEAPPRLPPTPVSQRRERSSNNSPAAQDANVSRHPFLPGTPLRIPMVPPNEQPSHK